MQVNTCTLLEQKYSHTALDGTEVQKRGVPCTLSA